MHRTAFISALAGLVVGTVVVGGVTSILASSGDETLHLCVSKWGRYYQVPLVVKPEQSCPWGFERFEVGPGSPGPAGPTGPTGPAGDEAGPQLDVITFSAEPEGSLLSIQSASSEQIPGMVLTVDVPAGEDRVALITFSANLSCTQTPFDADSAPFCSIAPVIGSHFPQPTAIISPIQVTEQPSEEAGYFGTSSFQWISDPLAPGSHIIHMEWSTSAESGELPILTILKSTFSVQTFPASDADVSLYYNGP